MTLNLQMMGRTGNQMFQYAHAKALAERDGLELRTPRWVGEKIFQIEPTAEPDYSGQYLSGYFQNQHSAIYTQTQVRAWFKFQPWVHELLGHLKPAADSIVGHLRRGDFHGYGYPIPNLQSYYNCCHKFGLDVTKLCFVLEECPTKIGGLTDEFDFLPDFYIMCHAATLLRANSTYSWWASVIGGARTFCPDIDEAPSGECLVEFEEGNHKKMFTGENFTDIVLKP